MKGREVRVLSQTWQIREALGFALKRWVQESSYSGESSDSATPRRTNECAEAAGFCRFCLSPRRYGQLSDEELKLIFAEIDKNNDG